MSQPRVRSRTEDRSHQKTIVKEAASAAAALVNQPRPGRAVVEVVEVSAASKFHDKSQFADMFGNNSDGSSSDSAQSDDRQMHIHASRSKLASRKTSRSQGRVSERDPSMAICSRGTRSCTPPASAKGKMPQSGKAQKGPPLAKQEIPLAIRKWMPRGALRKAGIMVATVERNKPAQGTVAQKSSLSPKPKSVLEMRVSIKQEPPEENDHDSSSLPVSSSAGQLTPDCSVRVTQEDFKSAQEAVRSMTKSQPSKLIVAAEESKERMQRSELDPNRQTGGHLDLSTHAPKNDLASSRESCADANDASSTTASAYVRLDQKSWHADSCPPVAASQERSVAGNADCFLDVTNCRQIKTEPSDPDALTLPAPCLPCPMSQPPNPTTSASSSARKRKLSALENDSTSGHSTDASDREMGRMHTQSRVATRKRSKVCCFACLSRGSADAELLVSPYKDGLASRVQDQNGATTAGERQQCSRCGSHVAANPGHDTSFPKLRADFLKASHCMTMTSAMRRAQRERVTRYPHQVLKYWYKASWKRRGNWRLSPKNTYLLRHLLHKSSKLRKKPSIEDIVKKISNSIPVTDKSQIFTAPDKPVAEPGCDGVRSLSSAVSDTEHSVEATERTTHVSSQESSPISDAASALPGGLSPQLSLLSGPASDQETQCIRVRENSLVSWNTSSSKATTTETLKTNTGSIRIGNNESCEKDSMKVTVSIESERVNKSLSIERGPDDGLETGCAKSMENLPNAKLSKTVDEEDSDQTRAVLEDQESQITKSTSKRDPTMNTKAREDEVSSNEAKNVSCQSQDFCSAEDAFSEQPETSPPSDLASEEEPYSPSEWKEDLPKSLEFNVSAGLLEEFGEKMPAEHMGATGNGADSPQEEDVLEAKASSTCKEMCVEQERASTCESAIEKVLDMTVETKLSSKAKGCMMTEKTSVGCEGKLLCTEAIDMKSQQCPEKNEVMEGTEDVVGKSAETSDYTGITEKSGTSFQEDVSESKGSETTEETPVKCERTLLSASVSETEPSSFMEGKEDLDCQDSMMTDKISAESSNSDLISLEFSEIELDMFSEEEDSGCQDQDRADGTSVQREENTTLCMEACDDRSDGFPEKDVDSVDPEVTSSSEKDNLSCHANWKEDSSDCQMSDAHECTEFSDLEKSSCDAGERVDEKTTVLTSAAVAGSNFTPVATPTHRAAEYNLVSADKVPLLENTLPSATSESILKGRVKSRIPVRVKGYTKNQGTPPRRVPKQQPPNSSPVEARSEKNTIPSSVLPYDSGNLSSEFCRQEKVAVREKERAQRRAEVKTYLKKRRMIMKKLLFGSVKSEMHLRKKSNHKTDDDDCSEGVHGIDKQKQVETTAKGSESQICTEDYGRDARNLAKDQQFSRKHGTPPETLIRRDRKLAKDAVSCHRKEASRGISQVLEKPTVKKSCLSNVKSVGHDSLQKDDEPKDQEKGQSSTTSVVISCAGMTGLDTEGSGNGFQTPMESQSRSVHPRQEENPFIYDQSSSGENTDFRPPSGCCTSDEQTPSQEPQKLQKWHSSSESLQEDDPMTRRKVLQADPLAATSQHGPGKKSYLVTGAGYLEPQPESPVRMSQVKKRLFWNHSVSDSMGKVLNEEPVQKFRRLETDCQNASGSLGVHMGYPGYPSIDRELEYKSNMGDCGSSSSFLNGIPSSHETMSLTFSSPQEQQEAVTSLMSFVDTLPPADNSADLEDDTMSSSLPSCSMALPLGAGSGTGKTGSLGPYSTAQPVEQAPYSSLHLSGVNQVQANCSQNSYLCSSVSSQRRTVQDFATKFYSAQSYPYLTSSECSPHAFMYPPAAGGPHVAAQEMMMMMNIQSSASESLQDLYTRTMSLAMMLSHFLPQGNQQMHGHSGNGTPVPGSTSKPCRCSPGVLPPTEFCKDAAMGCSHAVQHHILPGKRMPEDHHHQASHMGRFNVSNIRQVEKLGFQECSSKSVGTDQDGTAKIRNLKKLVKQETCTAELDNCGSADRRDSQISPLVSRKISEALEPSPSTSDQSSCSVMTCCNSGLQKTACPDGPRAAVPKLPQSSTSSSARTAPSDTPDSRDGSAGGAPGEARVRHIPRRSPNPVDGRLQCACNMVAGPIMLCVPLPPNALTASPHDSGISSSEGSAYDFLHEAVQGEGADNDINPRVVLHKLPDGEWEVRSDSSHKSPTQGEILLTDTEDEGSSIQQGNDSSKNERQTPEESIDDLATERNLWKTSASAHSSTGTSRPGSNPRISLVGNFDSSSLRKEKSTKPSNAIKQEKMKDEKLTLQPRRVGNPASCHSSIVEMVKPEPPGLPSQQYDSHHAKGSLRRKVGEEQSDGSAAMTGDVSKKKHQDHTGQKALKRPQAESRTSNSSPEEASSPVTQFEKAIHTSESKKSLSKRKDGCDKKEQSKEPLGNEHSSRNLKEVVPTGKKSKSSDEHTVRKPCESKVGSNLRELSLERNASSGKTVGPSGSGCKKRKRESDSCSTALKSEKENGKGKRDDWYSLMEKAVNDSIVDEENLGPSEFSGSTSNSSPQAAPSCSFSSAPKQSSERKTCESRNIKGRNTEGGQSAKARAFGLGRIIDCSASQEESSGSEETTSSEGENNAPRHSVRINHSQGNAPEDMKMKKGEGEAKDTCSRPVSPCDCPRSETLANRGSPHSGTSELDDGMKIVSDKIRLRKMFGCSSGTTTMPKPAMITTISPDCGDSRLVVLVKRSHSHQQGNNETPSIDCSMTHSISETKQPKRGAGKRKSSTPSARPISDKDGTSVSAAVRNAKCLSVTLEEIRSPEQDTVKESALEKKKQRKSKNCPKASKNDLKSTKVGPKGMKELEEKSNKKENKIVAIKHGNLLDDLFGSSSDLDAESSVAESQHQNLSHNCKTPDHVSDNAEWENSMDCSENEQCDDERLFGKSETRKARTAVASQETYTKDICQSGKRMSPNDILTTGLASSGNRCTQEKTTHSQETMDEINAAVASILEGDSILVEPLISPLADSPVACRSNSQDDGQENPSNRLLDNPEPLPGRGGGNKGRFSRQSWQNDNDSASDSDVLSLYAPSDASFLDDDIDDKMEEEPRLDHTELNTTSPKAKPQVDSGTASSEHSHKATSTCVKAPDPDDNVGGRNSEAATPDLDLAQMEQDYPSMTGQEPTEEGELSGVDQDQLSDVEVDHADTQETEPVVQKVWSSQCRIAIPDGYCFSFVLHDRCSKSSCPYRHAKPSAGEMYLKLINKINFHCQHGEPLSAMECYRVMQSEKLGKLEAPELLMLFYSCLHSGLPQPAFQLVPALRTLNLITAEVCTAFLRACLPFSLRHAQLMWRMFEEMSALSLFPAPDALAGLLRSFYELEDVGRLVPMLNYSRGCPGVKLPTYVVEWTMREVAATGSLALCRQASQWVHSAQPSDLATINCQILKALTERYKAHNLLSTSAVLEKAFWNSTQGQEEEEEGSGSGEVAAAMSPVQTDLDEMDPEEVKSWVHRIKGCRPSHNWQYLASIFLELCDEGSLWPAHFVPAFLESLTDVKHSDRTIHNLKVFTHMVLVEYSRQQPVNVLLSLDRTSLSRIGGSLCVKLHKAELWGGALDVLTTLRQASLPLGLGALDLPPTTVALAMLDTCLQAEDHSGLACQLLQECSSALGGDLEPEEGSRLLQILHGLVAMEIKGANDFGRALELLTFALSRLQWEADESREGWVPHINVAVMGALGVGEVGCAVRCLDLYLQHLLPPTPPAVLHPDPLRALLAACDLYGLKDKVSTLLQLGKKLCYYPDFAIAPCVDVLPLRSFWTRAEVRAVLCDHLENLYHYLCNKLVDRHPLTQADLVMVCRTHVMWPPQQVNLPYVSASPRNPSDAQELLLSVLTKDLSPALLPSVSGDGHVIIMPASLEKFLQALDRRGRRLGLVFHPGLAMPTMPSLPLPTPPPLPPKDRGAKGRGASHGRLGL